jgi:hypothetical protein
VANLEERFANSSPKSLRTMVMKDQLAERESVILQSGAVRDRSQMFTLSPILLTFPQFGVFLRPATSCIIRVRC